MKSEIRTTEWRGRSGVTLAAGVALAIVIAAATLLVLAVQTGEVSGESATILTAALGTAIGALATYLGGQRTHEKPDPAVPPSWNREPDISRLDQLDTPTRKDEDDHHG